MGFAGHGLSNLQYAVRSSTLVKSIQAHYSPKIFMLQCEDREQLDSIVGTHAIGSSRAGRKRFVARLSSPRKNDS